MAQTPPARAMFGAVAPAQRQGDSSIPPRRAALRCGWTLDLPLSARYDTTQYRSHSTS